MSINDIITKNIKNIVIQNMKDTVSKTLYAAVRNNILDLNPQQIKRIVLLISQTLDASFHKTNKAFLKSIKPSLESFKLENTKSLATTEDLNLDGKKKL